MIKKGATFVDILLVIGILLNTLASAFELFSTTHESFVSDSDSDSSNYTVDCQLHYTEKVQSQVIYTDGGIKIPLTNYRNQIVSMPIGFGDPTQDEDYKPSDSIFTITLSTYYSAVTLYNCTTCATQYYTPDDSICWNQLNDTSIVNATLMPQNAQLGGKLGQDLMQSNPQLYLYNFTFMMIDYAVNFEATLIKPMGIIGLGRPPLTMTAGESLSFIDQLYQNQIITRRILGIQLTRLRTDINYLAIGFHDQELYTGSVSTFEVYQDAYDYASWWNLRVLAANFGNQTFPYTLEDTAILETSSSDIYLPVPMWKIFSNQLKRLSPNWQCNMTEFFCYSEQDVCSDKYDYMPDLAITFANSTNSSQNNTYYITPEAYLVGDLQGYPCGVAITASEDYPYYILGQPFFRQFFVQLDFDNNTIQLAANSLTPTFDSFGSLYFEVSAVVLVLYSLLLIALYIWRNRKYNSLRIDQFNDIGSTKSRFKTNVVKNESQEDGRPSYAQDVPNYKFD